MTKRRSVVLNGDLGSGKTTVSVLLAQHLGLRRISVGDLYRTMAAERGMTALQLNLHAELDDKIDHYVDQLQADIAASGEQLVVDSRLAWHFFTDAIKVHMVVDPAIAARRVLGRPANDVENYRSFEEAQADLARRSDSERSRFITRYGVDKTRLRNYDIVCDSSSAGPEEIVERIAEHLREPRPYGPEPLCYLDPRRIVQPANAEPDGPLGVGYLAPEFFAVRGRDVLDAAIRSGGHLVEATLVIEADELVAGRGCRDYVEATALM